MKILIFGSLLLFLVAVPAQAQQAQELLNNVGDNLGSGDIDYETALRPATHKKRSISSVLRLLIGGNPVPKNHPLVTKAESKSSWSLAENILAALPAADKGERGDLLGSASGDIGWGWRPTTGERLGKILATKAKIIPYTGQVAAGLTGIAAVKADVLRQLYSLSAGIIAQAAAQAAARAVSGAAAAAHVSSSVAHAAPPVIDAVGKAIHATTAAGAAAAIPILNHVAAHSQAYGNTHTYGNHIQEDVHQGWHSMLHNSYAPAPKTGENLLHQPSSPAIQNLYLNVPQATPTGNGQYQPEATESFQQYAKAVLKQLSPLRLAPTESGFYNIYDNRDMTRQNDANYYSTVPRRSDNLAQGYNLYVI